MSANMNASDSEESDENIILHMSSTENDTDNADVENRCVRNYPKSPILKSRRKSYIGKSPKTCNNLLFCDSDDPNNRFLVDTEEQNEYIIPNFASEDELNSNNVSYTVLDPLDITGEENTELQCSSVLHGIIEENNEKQTKHSRESTFKNLENLSTPQNMNLEFNKMQESHFCTNLTNSISIPSTYELSSEESEDYFCSFRYCQKRVLIISSSSENENENSVKSDSTTSTKIIKNKEAKLNYCFKNDFQSTASENDTIFMKRKSRHFKYPNTDNNGNCGLQKRAKIRTINTLKKYLEKIGISLNRYKDFWNDCKENAYKMTRFIKHLLNKLDSSNIAYELATIKKEIEIYQESLILNKELVISYNERVTRSKSKAIKILMRQKILNSYKEYRCKKIRTLQLVPPTFKHRSLDYVTLHSSISSLVDE